MTKTHHLIYELFNNIIKYFKNRNKNNIKKVVGLGDTPEVILWPLQVYTHGHIHITHSHIERKEENEKKYLNRFSAISNLSLPLRFSTVCWFVRLFVFPIKSYPRCPEEEYSNAKSKG